MIEEYRNLPTDRKVGLLHLLYLLKLRDPALQRQTFKQLVTQEWTVQQLRTYIEQISKSDMPEISKLRANSYYDLTIPPAPEDFSQVNLSKIRESDNKPTKVFTHFDTPSLLFPNGKTIDEYPPDLFIGKCIVLNMECSSSDDVITLEWAKKLLDRHYLPPRWIVFVYTGWNRYLGQPKYYAHPVVDVEFAEWLVEKETKIFGIDMPNPERSGEKQVHKTLLQNDVLIIENLGDMSRIAGKKVTVYAMPINIKNSEVAPARVVAKVRTRRKAKINLAENL